MNNRKEIINWTLFIAFISNLVVFTGIYLGWFGPENGTGGNFCEAARVGLIKQPSNTFSNMGFVFAGIFASYQLYKGQFEKNANELTRTRFFPIFLCAFMVLLGPGSMAMHATETSTGGYFDMLSMYLIAAIMFSYSFKRLFHTSTLVFIIVFTAAIAICHMFHYSNWQPPILGFAGSFIFAILLIIAMLGEFAHQQKDHTKISSKWAIACSLTFITAFAIWLTGTDEHPWCNPDSLIQAHAIWHLLCALSVYFLFRLYASENDVRFEE